MIVNHALTLASCAPFSDYIVPRVLSKTIEFEMNLLFGETAARFSRVLRDRSLFRICIKNCQIDGLVFATSKLRNSYGIFIESVFTRRTEKQSKDCRPDLDSISLNVKLSPRTFL